MGLRGRSMSMPLVLLAAASFLFGFAGLSFSAAEHGPPLHRIVVFEPGVGVESQRNAVRAAGGRELRPLGIINAVAAVLPDAASERALRSRFDVVRIDEDLPVQAHGIAGEIPWGVARVHAPVVWDAAGRTGAGVRVAVADTGIQKNHPDLVVAGGYLALMSPPYHRRSRDDWDDDNGHGTHVAGTVAASGAILGVAPGAQLYAVKVLDRSGSGTFSTIIAGLEWCIENEMDVVNKSLGASSGNQSLHDAIKAAHGAGIIIVASAGNSGPGENTISYPAAYPETIAVAACDSADGIASWSSRGGEKGDVDLTAPGVQVKSTWNDGGYRTISGTSMAAPHVSGVAALVIEETGGVGPEEMWVLLTGTAEDLGRPFNAQGYGIVRADLALGAEAEPAPAFFRLSNLDPDHITTEPGEIISVSVDVTNTGDEGAVQDVRFRIGDDSASLQTRSVALGAGESQSVSFSAGAPQAEGSYVFSLWTDDDSLAGELLVRLDGEEEPGEPVVGDYVSVGAVTYSTHGGRYNDRHLTVTVSAVDAEGAPVGSASVSVEIMLDGSLYVYTTGSTGSDGLAVFGLNNAPSGTYTTEVLDVLHDALEFDGETPENSFTK